MIQVFTTTASLGPLASGHGQECCVPVAKAAGCAGIEIRRELFQEENPSLAALEKEIKTGRLVSVYSAPVELWNADGSLNTEKLDVVIPEALVIGAVWLKTSLGHYQPGTSDLAELEQYWASHVPAESALKLTVENDQTPHGGNVRKLQRFFGDCLQAGLPICMTFDIGNWNWTGEEGLQAAAALGNYVGYIHLKHVETVNGKFVTLALPEESGSLWRSILSLLPQDVPRTIEFPVEGEDLIQALKQYVAMIAEA
ncbi:sugar phosphate isomerase/epimerase [Paenibacillus sp. BR2-3]|uniref:sugar phosphate isomerase/epimerase family protein n=1 Tax=Paenibacillus sp. BR2-3 TaxID=3048494 RepID=UPI003977A016